MKILKDWIENVIKDIKSADKKNERPTGVMSGLRRLQLRLNPLIFADIDPQTKFLAYFLSCYVDTILMDLCGDTPDDSDERLTSVRNDFFNSVTGDLGELVAILDAEKNPLPVLENFVALYTHAVNKLNYLDNQ